MTELACTPGQTVGPFFGLALPYPGGSGVVDDAHPEAVRLHGTVYDGAGDGVPDARQRLIARYDHNLTEPEYATGYRWDIVLSGPGRTWSEAEYV